jgi:LysM repeat protein
MRIMGIIKKSRWSPVVLAIMMLILTTAVASAVAYIVRPGDTLWRISRQFGTTVNAIVAANPAITNPNLIYIGQVIEVPTGPTGGLPPPATPPPGPPTPVPPPPSGTTYVVQRGDTLSRIAARFGTTVAAIVNANPVITNPNLIYVGQVLTIPTGGGTVPPPPPPPPPSPPPTGGFVLGGQTQSLANSQLMKDAGMTWVKLQYKWTAGDSPDAVAGLINDAHTNGFKVLLSITGAQVNPPPGGINFTSFEDFIRGVAGLGPDAIEVWNEQNINREWPAGEINPATYVNNMLGPAYNAIKSANNNILVISGAPAPTGVDDGTNVWADNRYLAGMRAAGAANFADCIGVHHNAGATSPAARSGHPTGSDHYSWYFYPTLELYYNTFGGARQLCFTELGYLSGEGFSGLPAAFSWASGTSAQEHAQWLREARDLSRTDTRVRMLIVFNVDFTQFDPQGDPQAGYAMVRPDGSCPACDQFRQ